VSQPIQYDDGDGLRSAVVTTLTVLGRLSAAVSVQWRSRKEAITACGQLRHDSRWHLPSNRTLSCFWTCTLCRRRHGCVLL